MDQLAEKQPQVTDPLRWIWNHDLYTFQHSLRVADILYKFGQYLQMGENELIDLYNLGIVHDIGKLNIPLDLLRKEGPITHIEKQIFMQHPASGYSILKKEGGYSQKVLDGVLYHHENCDGTGYPLMISHDNIPLYARMLRIVDSFDAMTNIRSYSDPITVSQANKELHKLCGYWYDRELVLEFTTMINEIVE